MHLVNFFSAFKVISKVEMLPLKALFLRTIYYNVSVLNWQILVINKTIIPCILYF